MIIYAIATLLTIAGIISIKRGINKHSKFYIKAEQMGKISRARKAAKKALKKARKERIFSKPINPKFFA